MDNLTHSLAGAILLWIGTLSVPLAAQERDRSTEAPVEKSFLLVELLGPSKMIGFPAVCPGSSPDEDQSEVICLAELYEAPARVIQNLGGAKTGRRLNIRFTAHSFHAVWKEDVRFLLGVVPFEDKGRTGLFAYYWDWEDDRGEFCVGAEDVEGLEPPIRDFYAGGRTRKASARDENWERGYEIACTKGRRIGER